MARESILYGNEFRGNLVNEAVLDQLLNSFAQLSDPRAETTLNTILTPLVHEQFPHHESLFEEVARS